MSVPIVTVYTAGSSCQACTLTKRHLTKIGVAFTEVPLDSDEGIRAAAIELGLSTAPIVCVQDGDEGYCFDGYRPDKLDALQPAV